MGFLLKWYKERKEKKEREERIKTESWIHLNDEDYDYASGFLDRLREDRLHNEKVWVFRQIGSIDDAVAREIIEIQHSYEAKDGQPDWENIPTYQALTKSLEGKIIPHIKAIRIEPSHFEDPLLRFIGTYPIAEFEENNHKRNDPLLWNLGLKQIGKTDVSSSLFALSDGAVIKSNYGRTAPNEIGKIYSIDLWVGA